MPQCNLLGIDYCSIHLWPDNWNTFDTAFPTTWITAHEAATKTLNKPLVLEEVSIASATSVWQDTAMQDCTWKAPCRTLMGKSLIALVKLGSFLFYFVLLGRFGAVHQVK